MEGALMEKKGVRIMDTFGHTVKIVAGITGFTLAAVCMTEELRPHDYDRSEERIIIPVDWSGGIGPHISTTGPGTITPPFVRMPPPH
jgi:hypothetical protein